MNLPMALRNLGSFGLLASLAQLSQAQALTTATIMDPACGNMKALTVSIPAGWQFHQESQFKSARKGAGGAMNARTTAASDWADYSLDQQTVNGYGGLAKVSSAYSQTWSNGQNQWFQTNNPNSDPNGTLNGNWTRDTKVHGNGQPY